MFTLYVYIYIIFSLLGTLSLISVHKRLLSVGRVSDAKMLAENVVQDLSKNIASVCKLNVSVFGKENIVPGKVPAIYIGNHQSAFDIIILINTIGVKPFIAKSQLSKIPILRYWIKAVGCIFVERETPSNAAKVLKNATGIVNTEKQIVIFPEGTRTKDGNLLPFKAGAFRIAKYTNCLICPFVINGSGKLFELNNKKLSKDTKVSITFLQKISTENLNKEDWKELPEKCYSIISSHLQK